MAFRGIDIRETGDRLVFRAFLQTSAGAILTTGTTTLAIYELQSDGTLSSYDFGDDTFKTTLLGTATLSLTHRTGNNGSTNTGIWTGILATLTGFTAGNIYLVQVTNAGASPVVQSREFQFGSGVLSDVVAVGGTAQTARDIGADTANLVTRIPSALFSGITSMAQWLGLLAGKQTGNSTARTELRATGAGSGTYDETTDSGEAIRDRGDAAWVTGASGGGDATEANQTTIIGLISNGVVMTSSPVDPATNTAFITRNATYDGVARPKLPWTVTKDYTGWTGTFTINHKTSGAEICTASVVVASSTLLNVTLTAAETDFPLLLTDEEFGHHPYDIQMTSGSSVDVIGPYRAQITKDVTGV